MKAPQRVLIGTLFLLLGAGLIVLEIAWTTREFTPDLPLPTGVVNVTIFILGLAGLMAIYAGYRMVRGK